MTRWSYPRTDMLVRCCFALLLACIPAWCQVDTSSSDAANGSAGDTQLRVPPPVSGQAYPTEFAGDTEQNYWRGGFTLSSGYTNNVTGSTNPLGSMFYSFWPTISIDKVTSRLQLALSYSPGFTFYQHASGYNQADQNVKMNLQYRISPNLTISLQDGFNKSSNHTSISQTLFRLRQFPVRCPRRAWQLSLPSQIKPII